MKTQSFSFSLVKDGGSSSILSTPFVMTIDHHLIKMPLPLCSVELAKALTQDFWTKDGAKRFYEKLDSLDYNTLQILILWLTKTSAHTSPFFQYTHGTYSSNTLAHTSLLYF